MGSPAASQLPRARVAVPLGAHVRTVARDQLEGGKGDDPMNTNTQQDLIADAKQYIRAGGTLTRGDWETMEPEEREAHVEAGRQLDLERAVLIAMALKVET